MGTRGTRGTRGRRGPGLTSSDVLKRNTAVMMTRIDRPFPRRILSPRNAHPLAGNFLSLVKEWLLMRSRYGLLVQPPTPASAHLPEQPYRQRLQRLLPGFSVWFHWRSKYLGQREIALDVREIEVRHDQEEGRAHDKHVVIVLVDVGKRTGPGFGD